MIHSSAASDLIFIPSNVFFISVVIFFNSDRFFIYDFYLLVEVLAEHIYFSVEFDEHLYDFKLYLVDSLSLFSFVSSPGFRLFSFVGTQTFVSSF